MAIANRLLLQLFFTLAFLTLAGCADVLDPPKPRTVSIFPDRVAAGAPEYKEINTTFFSSLNDNDNTLVLNSFDPENFENDSISILESNSELILNLELEDKKVTFAVNNNVAFVADHQSNEIRRLSTFANPICEVLPSETVKISEDDTTVDHRVINSPWVYLVTTSGIDNVDCDDPNQAKQYLKLPFNYTFDANPSNEEYTNIIDNVSEAEARAFLVFGWVDDEESNDPNNKILEHGYIGYSFKEQKLVFYDQDKTELWKQNRTIEAFETVKLENGTQSPSYLASISRLGKTHYMMQLGLDIFVFDASNEFFDLNNSSINQVLSDKAFTIDPLIVTNQQDSDLSQETLPSAKYLANDTEIIFIDQSKIYQLTYKQDTSEPSSIKLHIVSEQETTADSIASSGQLPFTQFDLSDCQFHSDEAACDLANNPHSSTNPSWQFITDCEESLGCEILPPDNESCVITPSGIDGEILCTVSNYEHLDELDDPANNAVFKGFMQYRVDYMRAAKFALHDDSLFITARMLEHDILIRYFYNIDLLAPKSTREQVLLGSQITHQAIDVMFKGENLYITSLTPKGQTRTNECYKLGKQVKCEIENTTEEGDPITCTGLDLLIGSCVDFYEEYDSNAYLCTMTQVENNNCTDLQISGLGDLSVVDETYNAKWIELLDTSNAPPENNMFVFRGNKSDVIDEGVLINAQLFKFNEDEQEIEEGGAIGSFERIEDVMSTSYYLDATFARIDVLASDPLNPQTERSRLDTYFVLNPDDAVNSQSIKVGTRKIKP